MSKAWVWFQRILVWLPVWALYTTLLATVHAGSPLVEIIFMGLRGIAAAALLGLLVRRLAERLPWPRPFRPAFLLIHLVAAVAYSIAWLGLVTAMELVFQEHPAPLDLALRIFLLPSLVLGAWFYVMVAGVTYAARATERAARAEAIAVSSRLAALRGQLNPHFLFNALHTVVQLIPREPRRAALAAEQIAGLLRTTIEEDRDLVTLAEEVAFVERYLDIERIRFGERLRVHIDVSDAASNSLLPSFALQTLVENAVRHGAAPRVDPTDITIVGKAAPDRLRLIVEDTGAGAARLEDSDGTGLQRLRERLGALYGSRAELELTPGTNGGFTASLTIPQAPAD